MNIFELSARDLGAKIGAHELGVVEVSRLALERIAQNDSKYNAFISIDAKETLQRAQTVQKLLDSGRLKSPLAGVPLAVKDNICTGNLPTTCASEMLRGYRPPFSATVIERLEARGAVILGKTNLDEFAIGSTNETSAAGAVRNPWSTGRSPGGSSGGSAAALAAHESWYALGSDTGGSIRQPCAFCNLTGLKPTYGTVSRYGLIAYASSMDQIGPMARSAADCALAMSLFAGYDPRDSTSLPPGATLDTGSLEQAAQKEPDLQGLKIGLPETWLDANVNSEISRSIYRAAEELKNIGAEFIPVQIPLTEEAVPAYYLIAAAEASSNLARYDGIQYGLNIQIQKDENLSDYYARIRSAGFGREVQRRILLGTFALSAGYYESWYLKALQVRQLIIDCYRQIFTECDFILAPVTVRTAPPLGTKSDDPLGLYLQDVFTVAANLAGLPALAMPCGLDSNDLPIGMQLVGPPLADAGLLACGSAYQQVTDYHLAVPGEVQI